MRPRASLLLFQLILFIGIGVIPVSLVAAVGVEDQTPQPAEALFPEPRPGETLSAAPKPEANKTFPIRGRLFEKGTRHPLADVNVFILPAKLKAVTGPDGRFEFLAAPAESFTFAVNASDYLRMEKLDQLTAENSQTPRNLYLERAHYESGAPGTQASFETTVKARAERRDDNTRTMEASQFLTMPGAGGDPVKAIQNLPGIARSPGGGGNVIIQGSAPQDTQYLIENHSVPLIFHFGGLTSVVTPEAVSQIDYLSAGYGPEFGRAMGGIVGLQTREPAKDRTKGFVFIDTAKAGGLIEGPIDKKSSYLFSARYSYIGAVLALFLKNNDQLNLTVAPSFADTTAIYQNHLSAHDEFKLTAIGSRDELKFLFKEPLESNPSIRGSFDNETLFYRFIPQWTHTQSESTKTRASLAIGEDKFQIDFGDNYLITKAFVITQRAEMEIQATPKWRTYLGLDDQFARYHVSARVPAQTDTGGVMGPISTANVREFTSGGSDWRLAPYWRNTYKHDKFTVQPSVRGDYFSRTKEFRPGPRLALRYDLNQTDFLRAASGLYYQPPQVQETDPSYGNADLKSPYAIHYTVGYERDLRQGAADGFVLNTGLFYRDYRSLVVSSSDIVLHDGTLQPEIYNNSGTGRSYGLEMLLKYDHKPWSGWVSYTLSRSTRTELAHPEHPFQFDQTHNINVVGQIELKRNLKVSGRVRYVTGNAQTPVASATFDADNDVYIPHQGNFYSARLSPFFQLDARLDKKWIYDRYIISGYIDIQNLTNHGNPESIRYSYDYSQSKEITGLPIFPTLGVQGEF